MTSRSSHSPPTPTGRSAGSRSWLRTKIGPFGSTKLVGLGAAVALAIAGGVAIASVLVPEPWDVVAADELQDASQEHIDAPRDSATGSDAAIAEPAPLEPAPLEPAPLDPSRRDSIGDPPVQSHPLAPEASAPGVPIFDVDTGQGIVDPILAGTASPRATIEITTVDAMWSSVADAAGAWRAELNGFPTGLTSVSATQIDASGLRSPGATVEIELESATARLQQGAVGPQLQVGGRAGATVEVLGLDQPSSVTLDDQGRFLLDAGPSWLDASIEVRHTLAGRTGPSAGMTLFAGPEFEADTADGLVDPILTGTAEPFATIKVTAADRDLVAHADASGEWRLDVDGLPFGVTAITASQRLSDDSTSFGRTVEIELSEPTVTVLRQSGGGFIDYYLVLGGRPGAELDILGIDSRSVLRHRLSAETDQEWIGFIYAAAQYDSWITADIRQAYLSNTFEVRYIVDGRTGPISIDPRRLPTPQQNPVAMSDLAPVAAVSFAATDSAAHTPTPLLPEDEPGMLPQGGLNETVAVPTEARSEE